MTGPEFRTLLAAILLTVLPRAASAAPDPNAFDQISITYPTHATLWRIDRPNVKQKTTSYPMIRFHRGDDIIIGGGGCVQTGGQGSTWKSYFNPQGGDADHLYSGTVYIPGVIPPGADGGYTRIGGQASRLLHVPVNLPPTIKDSDLYLRLGYQDDQYDDNGYYSHDDGNNDQCKNTGPAFVQVRVIRHIVDMAEYTSWTKPFDLAWKPSAIDANGLPVNPLWGGQIDPNGSTAGTNPFVQTPDFPQLCGPAFSWNYGTHGLDENLTLLNASCTSQSPTTDFDHSISVEPGPGSYCHPEPLSGHLDWLYATYTGTLFWEEYSGGWPGDGDYNFQLAPTAGASLTDQNNGGVGLEFQDSETIDNYASPFWARIRNDAENAGNNADIAQDVNGKFAIVTGLVGIDGVHGGYTEVHPVMTMAICVSGCEVSQSNDTPIPDTYVYGADQTWVFFVQNYGRGGNCSSSEHYWPGLPGGSDPTKAWYFLSFPWHPGATAVSVTHQALWSSVQIGTAKPAHWTNWAYMGFELPAPTNGAGAEVDGLVTLHYTLASPPPAHKAFIPPASVRGHADEGGEWKDVYARISDPAVRAQLDQLVRSTTAIRAAPHPHKVALTLGEDPGALRALAGVTPERARRPTRDRPFVDADQQRRKGDFYREVVKLVPLRSRPDLPRLVAPPPAAPARPAEVLRPQPGTAAATPGD